MTSLAGEYDAVLLDLDGTVHRGNSALPAAADAVARLRRDGVAVGFVTNNASRTARQVADTLASLGVDAAEDHVCTSAQTAAQLLADRLGHGSRVLVVGTDALTAELSAVGLAPVTAARDDPVAVVQGHSEDTGWTQLAEACLAIRAGAWWVACNCDPTLPTERGELPGNGAMVAALHAATEQCPTVAGKPARALIDTAVARLGVTAPLVVGDRLDTDIAAANAAGLDSLLVLSGVTDAAGVLAAPPGLRPSHLGTDLGALTAGPNVLRVGPRPGWRTELDGDQLVLRAAHDPGDDLDALRALCDRWWSASTGPPTLRGDDPLAVQALQRLGLVAPDTSELGGSVIG